MSEQPEKAAPLLSVRELTVDYRDRRRHRFRAVEQVSFELGHGETLGLVGESGSGKTTIARAIQGLVSPASGSIEIAGAVVNAANLARRRSLATKVQTVFQDPFGSLNPARLVGAAVAEPLVVQQRLNREELGRRVAAELERVGLSATAARRRPKEFSGGQRQRIAIARALIARPQLVICDEAVSALDLSVQAQILNLLADLQEELKISYLFITHDLAVVKHIASRIAVLERGRIVDMLSADSQAQETWSPYTRKLFDAAPVPDPARQRAKRLEFERLARAERDDAEALAP